MKYISMLRPQQWYKNGVIFLALLFSGSLTSLSAVENSILAFVSFCAIAGATYIINDIADQKQDELHPEKKSRPIASGAIRLSVAVLCALLLVGLSLTVGFLLPMKFMVALVSYFVLSQIYTVWLKHEVFADVLVIAINFVLRAVAGAFAIEVAVSPWLIGGVFFLALFLITGKRRGELLLLKENAKAQRRTLGVYTQDMMSKLSMLATTCVVMCYALFVFFGSHAGLFVTLPFAVYGIFRYDWLISEGSVVARHPHYLFTDWKLVLTLVLWLTSTILVLYG